MNESSLASALAHVAGADVTLLFPSPVMAFDWPESVELNHRLREVVVEKRQASPGVVKTNRGGWQSSADLQDWEDPAIRQLVTRIQRLVAEYVARLIGRRNLEFDAGWTIRAWANVNGKSNFNRSHNHLGSRSYLAGIYYVDVGDIASNAEAKGRTIFEDRTYLPIDASRHSDRQRRDFYMTPKDGRMVIFPAALMHSVEPYLGEQPRITIAFNLFHSKLEVPRIDEYLQNSTWMWVNFRGLMILKRKIPEKLYGLALIPQQLLSRRVSAPFSARSWAAHVSTAVHHAFALASERFESGRPKSPA